MATFGLLIAVILIGYFVGSIPTANIIMHRVAKRDLREVGTGNVTSTAVILHAGRLPGAISLIGEILKTFLCIFIAHVLIGALWAYLVILVAASVGQIWSIWLGGAGGRGQTIFVTGFLVLCPLPFLVGVAMFAVLLFTTKKFYLSNQVWHLITPAVLLLATKFNPAMFGLGAHSWAYALAGAAMVGMFFVRNRADTDDILQTQAWGSYSR